MNGEPAAGAADPADLGEQLGRAIRSRRRAKGLTLVQLAELCGLSNPFLSQLERGLARPSMESLHRIARALGTTTPGLLAGAPADDGSDGVLLTRNGEAGAISHDLGWTRPLVAGSRAMYPVEFMVTSHLFESYFQHEAAEFIYLLSGELEVDIGGTDRHDLTPGDLLYFPGGVLHRWRAPEGGHAHALVVQAGGDPHS